MGIELTPSQQEELDRAGSGPVAVRDPRSKTDYVLISSDQYEQMLETIEDDVEQRSLRRAAARTLGKRIEHEGP